MREHRGHKKRRYSRRTRRQHKHSCFHLCHHHLSSLDHKQRRHHWTLLDNDYVEHTHEGYTRRDEREEQEQQVKSCSNNTQAFLVIKLSSFIQKWLQPHFIQSQVSLQNILLSLTRRGNLTQVRLQLKSQHVSGDQIRVKLDASFRKLLSILESSSFQVSTEKSTRHFQYPK